jgi:ribosomal protein S18 acetylase RimI-like enzyme
VDSYFSSFLIGERAVVSNNASIKSQVIIRNARPSDINGLAEVLANSFHSRKGWLAWIYPILKLGIYEDLRARLYSRSPYSLCLVASLTVGGNREKIVGTVEISLRSSSFWSDKDYCYPYISNLAVLEGYRRQGVARQLLLKCERVALNWGFERLSLHVLENNDKAKKLYLKAGYQLLKSEGNIRSWLFQRPKRLFLNKEISCWL